MKASCNIVIVGIMAGLIAIPSVIYAEFPTKVTQSEHTTICKSRDRAKHAFIIKVKDEISAILTRVRHKITDNGGNFEGDTEHGTFDGKSALGTIRGEYVSISNNEVEVVITDKPFIIPYKTIECRVREYLN